MDDFNNPVYTSGYLDVGGSHAADNLTQLAAVARQDAYDIPSDLQQRAHDAEDPAAMAQVAREEAYDIPSDVQERTR